VQNDAPPSLWRNSPSISISNATAIPHTRFDIMLYWIYFLLI
jgi:hypothetical protein